jgi:hypothetical protein
MKQELEQRLMSLLQPIDDLTAESIIADINSEIEANKKCLEHKVAIYDDGKICI